ncbi:MAG: hypothetical protein ACHQIL_07145 [Steroidobacterales bacterium]
MRRLSIITCLSLVLLAACGGSAHLGTSGAGSSSSSGGSSSGGTKTTVSMGSGTGSGFQAGIIAISTASLSAGGSTSLQVSLVDQTGAAYTTSTTVTFSSPCVGQNLATITGTGQAAGTASVTTTTGTATATYVATGCSGSDVVTATATANNQNLTASGTVTVAQAAIGSIQFISANPKTITLKGVGSVGGSATSTVVFQVLDSAGGPRPGATVNFSLTTTVGGVTYTPHSGTTDANGKIQTVVSGGTVAEPVRVIATTTNTTTGATISTESNALTITTGIPTSANISLSVKCANVEAWDIDGVTVPVTVSMTDRFSNPVPDGTTANFQTTLGGITGSCQTGTTTPGSGACTVNWFSKTPYSVSGNPQTTVGNAYESGLYCAAGTYNGGPGSVYGGLNTCNGTTNGRSPILVYAIGEESFKDVAGTGVFNSTLDNVAFNASNPWNNFGTYTGQTNGNYLTGEYGVGTPPSGAPKAWDDVGDPFLNQWELGTCYAAGTVCVPIFVPGEFFYDYFNAGSWQGPDGLNESALCDSDTSPAANPSYCNTTSSSVAISASDIIIVSGNHANFTFSAAQPLTLPATLSVQITDDRFQQMPAGTTVVAAFSTNAGQFNGPSTYTWPCVAAPGGMTFDFNMAPTATPSSGVLTLTVTTPGGIITNAFYNLAN